MDCIKCKTPMYQAHLVGGMHSMDVWLTNKKKGVFESEKRSSVSCYVCPNCGYIELNADNPKGLQIPE